MDRWFFMPLMLVFLTGACVSPMPDEETLLHYARSQNVYREGRFAETALMLAGENKFVPALVLRGKAEYLSGNPEAAGKTLRRVLKLNPSDAEASIFLARLYRETGKPEEARKLTEKILGDNPTDIRALRFAAELARERGSGGEAASAALLDRAVEASALTAAESALVLLDRARLRWTGGNRSGALEDLGRAKTLLSWDKSVLDSSVLRAVERLEAIIMEVSL